MTGIVPTTYFAVDLNDTGVVPSRDRWFRSSNYSIGYGASERNVYDAYPARGAFNVHDPDGALDPRRRPDGDAKRLARKHRVWMIVDDFDPPDLSPRWTGWARLTHRPNDATARFELLSLLHAALLEEDPAPQFNSTAPPPPPPVNRRPPFMGIPVGFSYSATATSPTTAILSATVINADEDTQVYFSYQAGNDFRALEPVPAADGFVSIELTDLTPNTCLLYTSPSPRDS